MSFVFDAIGYLRTPFKERFGIPRQSGLAPAATAVLEFVPPYDDPDAVRGLSEFTHVWIVFVLHASTANGWQPLVRPPRLGGNEKRGVFASRSPVRPNPIGLSAVKLEAVRVENRSVVLALSGGDFLDGTPVLDVKPYVPYADAIHDAHGAYAHSVPTARLRVVVSALARSQLDQHSVRRPHLAALVEQTLALDPRPAYSADSCDVASYGMRIDDFDVRWHVSGDVVIVDELIDVPPVSSS